MLESEREGESDGNIPYACGTHHPFKSKHICVQESAR